nr:hypothetical protein [Lachnospiraceae bacterium]
MFMKDLRIILYDKKYEDLLKQTDSHVLMEINHNGDIIGSTVILAVSSLSPEYTVISGTGCLMRGYGSYCDPSYTGKRFVHASFKGYGEAEVPASDMLLDRLISIYKKEFSDHILRLWCRAKNTVYLDFLVAKGFSVENTM